MTRVSDGVTVFSLNFLIGSALFEVWEFVIVHWIGRMIFPLTALHGNVSVNHFLNQRKQQWSDIFERPARDTD